MKNLLYQLSYIAKIKGLAEYIFQYHFKCEDLLQPVGICPQVHKVLGKLETNLTFLTYQTGRLDLTRFNLIKLFHCHLRLPS